jgi:hypothetical protein
MKRIIVGIVCSLFLCLTGISTAHPPPSSSTNTLNDDVPIWQVGDSWTYTVNNLTVNYDNSGQKILVNGRIDDFTWTVVDTSDSTCYKVNFTGKLTASYTLKLSSISGNLDCQGTVKKTLTRLKGTMLFTKSDLQIHDITAEAKGLTAVIIAPLKHSLPFPFKLTVYGDFSEDFPLFDFPLNPDKYWNLPHMEITMQAIAGGIFGIFHYPVSISTEYWWLPFAFHCQDKQDITVPAGTYSAYTITSLFGEYFTYYYAPAAGNLIKIDATLQNGAVSAELKATTYS